ncbi:hypothetical protein ACEN8I_05290 [Polaromonas sp. CT11-55]|uniref:hypothetical protein n=1 Tax=Polaromonas sp. CT11-55 TaxID=3243045 RepID=UPI0039A476E1
MTEFVLRLTVRTASRDLGRQDALWERLIQWCEPRALFIGGAPESAVIYAPLHPITARRRRELAAWLDRCPEIQTYQLKAEALSDLRSLRAKAACLEAFSQAQRYLAERMAECSDALAGLHPPASRRWRASVGNGGNCLELDSRDLGIGIAIFRSNRAPHPQFSTFSGRYLELGDLATLELDWMSLVWAQVLSDGDLSVGQWVARSQHWMIHLYASTTAPLAHREVMLRWMEAVCES